MRTIDVSVLSDDEDEFAVALSAITTLVQSLGFKKIDVSMSINWYKELGEELDEEVKN